MSFERYAGAARALAVAATLCMPAVAGAETPGLQIAFQSDRGGNDDDLRLVDADSGKERGLTSNTTPDASPSWSPDATKIVYACAPAGNWEVCTVNPVNGRVTRLTRTAAAEFDPRYTSDGTQIVMESYPNGRTSDIAIMPATGGEPRPLMTTPAEDDQDPAPDPLSRRVAFATDGKIEVLVLGPLKGRTPFAIDAGSQAVAESPPVSSGAGRSNTDATFSRRDEIAFAGRRGSSLDILVAGPAVGGADRPLRGLTTGPADDMQPAWTADGSELFFVRSGAAGRGFRIFRIGADGAGRRAVTKGGAYDDMRPAPKPVSGGLLARALRVPPAASAGLLAGSSDGLLAVAATTCTTSNTINGTSKKDQLTGTSKAECIYGGGDDDKLTGKGGSDRLYGGSGDDKLYAIDNKPDYVNGGSFPGGNAACTDPVIDTRINTVEC